MGKVIDIRIQTAADLRGVKEVEQSLTRLAQAQKSIPKASGADMAQPLKATADAAQKAEKDVLRYATAMASAQKATGDAAGGVSTLRSALAQLTPNTIEANQAVARLATAQRALQKDLAGGRGLAQEFGASMKSNLLGIVGPAALAAGALAGISKAISATEEAFKFKAALDATTASITAQLQGVRDSGQVFAEAAVFAREFKLTQQETTEAIAASVGVMRASKAPIEDILSVLARLQVLSPEQSLQEAAVAVKALASGDTQSLVTRFEVSRDRANEMKQAIAGGADAVQVLNQFLNDTGIGMDALKAKTEGAAGAIKDAAIQTEKFKLALAGKSGGFGADLLAFKTNLLKEFTAILTGDFREIEARNRANAAAQEAYNDAIARGRTDAEAYAIAQEVMAQASADYAAQQAVADQATVQSTNSTALNSQAMASRAQLQQAATAATDADTAATDDHTAATTKSTAEMVLATLEAQTHAAQEELLMQAVQAAAGGMVAGAGAADVLARQFGITTGEAQGLINKLRELAQLQNTIKFAAGTSIIGGAGVLASMPTGAVKGIRDRFGTGAGQLATVPPRRGGGGGGRGGVGGGGGGGAARISEAEKTADRLSDIERQSSQRLAEIDEQTQQKLLDIDQKYAEQRAAAARELADEIARSSAATNFDQQLNDFDKFQKDLSDEQKAALATREKAEAEYNAKVAAAQEEAKKIAADGDAQYAEDVLKAKTDQAEREKEIAEKAAEAKRNVGKKGAAAVDREAAEATAASQRQADTDIAIAQAKAQERTQAQQQEKDAVVAEADEQKQKVVSAAEESAAKVKGASDSQKATVIANLRAQAAAIKTWADTVVEQAGRAQAALGGVTGPPATGGGEGGGGTGTGGTGTGGAGFRAARATGGGGGGSVADAIQTLNDAAEIIKVIKPFVASNKGAVKLLNEYSLTVKSAVASLLAIQDLRERLVQPAPMLDVQKVAQLKHDIETVLSMMMAIDASATAKVRVLAKYLETEKSAVEILNLVTDLRKNLSAPTPPITPAYVIELIAVANAVISLIFANLIPLKQREIDGLKTYAEAAGASVGILRDVADLRKDLSEQASIGPFNMGLVQGLVKRAAEITRMVETQLVPLTEQQATGFESYATGAGAAVSILKDTADLRKELSAQKDVSPFNMALIKGLAMRAREITQIVLAQIVPFTEEQTAAMQRYADSQGAAVAVIKDTADLRKELSEAPTGAIDPRIIQRLADDAKRITQIVTRQMVPVSEETADAAQRFADTTGSAVSTLKSVLELPAKMFTEYVSPSDAQIGMVVKDTNRIVRSVAAAAAVYKTEGLEAAQKFGDAAGSVLSAFKDQLLFAQALNSGDFVVSDRNLATFERGMGATIGVAQRLGAQAAAIPPGNIAALQAVAAANTASYESLIKLAAVPFGNLPELTGRLGGGGGIGPVSIVVNAAPGQNVNQIADAVLVRLNQKITARRS